MADHSDVVATPESPRVLRRTSDGAEVSCVSQMEYLTLTTTQGYRDVTDETAVPRGVPGPAGSGSGEAPAKSEPKSAWVDHAVSRGSSRHDAEAKTKEQLVADTGA